MGDMTTETRLALIEHEQKQIQNVLDSIADSISRLVALEERHAETRDGLNRAFTQIERLDTRTDAIEQQMPQLIETRTWVMSGLGIIVSSVIVALIALVVTS